MLDKYISEQPIACKILNNSITNNNISHAYLFISNQYSKTMDLVISFVKKIVTKDIRDEKIQKDIIDKIDKGIYNDLIIIDSEELWIKKEIVQNLQKEFSNKSVSGNKRVYIINNAHKLNKFSANSILKFLEEPEKNIIAILITDNKYQLLETIISRCVNINLIKDKKILTNSENTIKEKLANILFNNEKEIEEFIKNEENDVLINTVVDFINYYENNREQTISHLNKLWHEKIKNKKDIQIAFDLMIFFYTDVLHKLMNNNINIFNDYYDIISKMCKENTIKEICNKVNILIDLKGKTKYNVNNKLLMDKLVLLLGGELYD